MPKSRFDIGTQMIGLPALVQGATWSGKERNRLFVNQRGKRFEDASGVSGLDNIRDGRVFAVFDYDRDGWQDIALLNINSPVFSLYRNQIGERENRPAGRTIALQFVGGNHGPQPDPAWSHRDGYGTLVTVRAAGLELKREHRCGEGLSAQNSATMIIGIGAHQQVDQVLVRWPSGRMQELGPLPSGAEVTVFENPAQSPSGVPYVVRPYQRLRPPTTPPRAPAVTEQLNVDFKGNSGSLRMYTTTATWCPNCKALLPHLRFLRSRFSHSELSMFGVPIDPKDGIDELHAYQTKMQPAYELLSSLPAEQVARIRDVVHDRLQGDGLPATIVTDGDGAILLTTWGAPSLSELRKLRFDQR